jgi:ankyrin repeat protein
MVNAEDSEEGRTALMIACEKGYLEIVQELLENGALADHKDKKKRTALFYAVSCPAQNVDVVKELLDRKADVNLHSIVGMSPLLIASEKRHQRIMGVLLQHGADVKYQGGDQNNSALHIVCE